VNARPKIPQSYFSPAAKWEFVFGRALKLMGAERGREKEGNLLCILPNKLENFRLFAFAQLHALLHGGDDAVRLVFGAVLRALLRRP
jgi:hypothetical protein